MKMALSIGLLALVISTASNTPAQAQGLAVLRHIFGMYDRLWEQCAAKGMAPNLTFSGPLLGVQLGQVSEALKGQIENLSRAQPPSQCIACPEGQVPDLANKICRAPGVGRALGPGAQEPRSVRVQ